MRPPERAVWSKSEPVGATRLDLGAAERVALGVRHRLCLIALGLGLIAPPLTASVAESNYEAIVSHIPRYPVQSTALAAIGYSKKLHALEIQFRNGAIYRYLGVPMDIYRELLEAESKARYYDGRIRYRYQSLHVRTPAPDA